MLAKASRKVYGSEVDLSQWSDLTLRAITPEDETLLREIYASTRAEEMHLLGWSPAQADAFLRQQSDAQHGWYQTHFAAADFDLILERGKPVGRLYVHRQPHDLNVIDIALLPAHRGRGIGTFLMRQLLVEADRTGRTASLHVEGFNRARTLYERLGFACVADAGIYLEMRRPPAADIN